jgi:hypothetical protein
VGDDESMEGNVSFSEATRSLLGRNLIARNQLEAVNNLKSYNDHIIYNTMNAITKDIVKLVEDDPEKEKWSDYTQKLLQW